ncbi:DUF2752 domain-containing protein [Lacipirellula parvula]|uniref:DUF2752 domain-containing protein n=1 Tax=Lacipirellula parvula TaxID=2650471 RepID=A0A5K7XJ19_9BACT|nr:DUF2752 domain-containing protein [Lacipirellula parvula]BBO34376.1 hypothetical protein PLANPX_3988 [Lacipirellula parvula]
MAAEAISSQSTADGTDHDGLWQRRRAELHDRHWAMLVVALSVVSFAFLLRINDGGRVAASWLPFDSLPPLCGSRVLLGIECPGCGLTRSFVAFASGDFRESFRFHRLGWLVFLATAGQIPYRIVRLRQLRQGTFAEHRWPAWFGSFLIAVLIANWAATMIGKALST